MNVLTIGGSRNIGYYSSVRLLDAGCTVTFLLRNPSVFDADETIQKHVKSGKALLVKGDALIEQDVKRVWEEAAAHGPEGKVDQVIFTVGGTPKFDARHLVVVKPENLVTLSLLNVLRTMPPTSKQPFPRIVTISSTGLTKTSHESLPLLLKPLYAYILASPHKDKVGVERVVSHVCNWEWNPADGEPEENILPKGWQNFEGLPEKGSLKDYILVIRPALLTDGECKAEEEPKKKKKDDKPAYRVQDVNDGELRGWTVSRKDVAHFVVQAVSERWDEFKGKRVNIAY
ncbi:hypothetical protein K435DRAFT_778301 [Dendrothele bispora CBS 962.96]|uniref:NAD(P)-binding domain-containing protein n=1 Tax=Dendrothele bispora (strain CBS 962.96) TaxID=1314807 RepID=A0A4S8M434_DENBC|nr:hypothetical protein K435DRAFT_778301 [Dendrothele bispora CBS 962.96]